MNHDERQMIDGLFGRLQDAERSAPPRDPEAESFIRDRVASQPGAPYYMAQTIIVQEQALQAAQARIQELEAQGQRANAGGGGLLGSLFGGGSRDDRSQGSGRPMGAPAGYGRQNAAYGEPQGGSPWGGRAAAQPSRGGGFLAGAAQTAVGVAGGMMLGSMLGGMFAGGEAQAGEADPAADAGGEDMGGADDMGGMDDGGFGDFDF